MPAPRLTAALLVVLLLLGAAAHAQSMGDMKRDAQADFEKADAELNKTYKEVLTGLSPKGTAALKDAQRAWITFRDRSADAYGTLEEGGSLEGLLALRCSVSLTRERTAQLKKMFQSKTEGY